MMQYMKNGTQSGMRRMSNSKKSNQILGHKKKIKDVERMKLLSTDLELVIHLGNPGQAVPLKFDNFFIQKLNI